MANVATLQIVINSQGAVQNVNLLNQSLNTLQRTASRAVGPTNNLRGAFGELKAELFSLRGAIAGLGLGLFVREVIQTNLAFEQIKSTLVTASGSLQLAGKDFDFILEESKRLGLNLSQVGIEFARLAASARGTSLAGNTIKDVFSATAEAFVATGQNSESLRLGILALTQMISKGRVQAEELRGQFGERLPGAFQAAARALGMTTQQLNQALQSGSITAQQLLPKLAEELRKTFGSGFTEALNKPRVVFGQFTTAFQQFLDRIARSNFMDEVIKGVKNFTAAINEGKFDQLAQDLGQTLAVAAHGAGVAFKFLADNTRLVEGAFVALAASQVVTLLARIGPMLLRVGAALTGPIGLGAAALATLVGAFVYFDDVVVSFGGHTATVGDIINAFWNSVKRGANILYDTVSPAIKTVVGWIDDMGITSKDVTKTMAVVFGLPLINPIIASVLSIWDGFKAVFKFIGDAADAVVKQLGDKFTGIGQAISQALKGEFTEAGKTLNDALGKGIDLGGDNFFKDLKAKVKENFSKDFLGDAVSAVGAEANRTFGVIGAEAGKAFAQRANIEGAQKLSDSYAKMLGTIADMQREADAKATKDNPGLSQKEQNAIQRIEQRVEKLKLEVDERQRLLAVVDQGAAAVDAANRQTAIEEQLRQAKLTGILKEGSVYAKLAAEITKYAGVLFDLKKAEEGIKNVHNAFEGIQSDSVQMIFEAERWRDEQLAAIKNVGEGYDQLAFQIEAVYVAKKRAAEQRALADSKVFTDGLTRGLQNYYDSATNMAKVGEDAVTKTFSNMEDALVNFVQTGKFDFKSLVDSMLADIARLAIRSTILGPLAGLLGGAGGGAITGGGTAFSLNSAIDASIAANPAIFHSGGIVGQGNASRTVPMSLFANAARAHSGAYIGTNEVPIIAKRGEHVLTPQQYDSMSGGGMTNIINVNVDGGSSGSDDKDHKLATDIANQISNSLEQKFGKFLQKQMRPGGMLNQ